MKRKKFLLPSIIVLLFILLVIIALVPQTVQQQVKIPVPVTKAMDLVINSHNVKKWWIPFAKNENEAIFSEKESIHSLSMADDFIEIAVHNAFVAEVKTGNKERQKKFLISITPDSLNVFDSRVTLIYKTSYITKLFGNKDLENQAIASLENLKSYTENTSALYGFEINKALVTDPLFLFSTRQVDSINRQASTEELFKSLIEQANKKALGYTGVRIFHSQPEPNGKIMLFAGIGISVQFESKENDPMRFKGMPRGKNLIVATYEGPYKNIGKAYEALEEYMKDRSLTSMAMPFEKFISDGVGFADTQIVKINVTHPVY